jgi:Putative antitoxin of bacterial toxin-antitoxin system, YdaS/YdaT
MLRPLPFTTFAEIAALQLEAHVYCSRCYALRRIDPSANHVRDRCFAGTRFGCRRCDTPGQVQIRPSELLPIGGAVRLARSAGGNDKSKVPGMASLSFPPILFLMATETEKRRMSQAMAVACGSVGGQAALARAIRRPEETVSDWENGKNLVDPELVVEIERITGVSRHDLRLDLSRIFGGRRD